MSARRLKFERALLEQGITLIAGVDEPLAGPVVAAAVSIPLAWIENGLPRPLRGLNDSKQLTPEQRERYYGLLTASPEVHFGVASVDVNVIDEINILQATHRAMNEALAQLDGPGGWRRAELLHRRGQRDCQGNS
jgi:ribonuclease HII